MGCRLFLFGPNKYLVHPVDVPKHLVDFVRLEVRMQAHVIHPRLPPGAVLENSSELVQPPLAAVVVGYAESRPESKGTRDISTILWIYISTKFAYSHSSRLPGSDDDKVVLIREFLHVLPARCPVLRLHVGATMVRLVEPEDVGGVGQVRRVDVADVGQGVA